MKIAIIGAGNVGSALTRSFVRAGHDVTIAARNEARTRAVAEELGARAADSIGEAAAHAEAVVLAVPFAAVGDVARELAPVAADKVVIDTTNPLTPDYSGVATAGGPSVAEQVNEQLIDARVVKAFNTLFASMQADPAALGEPVDALFATDDDEARAQVSALLESVGFRPVDAGPLARARELEALAFLNIQLQMRHGGDWRSAFVLVGAPASATGGPPAAA